jgi:hypothetical protein
MYARYHHYLSATSGHKKTREARDTPNAMHMSLLRSKRFRMHRCSYTSLILRLIVIIEPIVAIITEITDNTHVRFPQTKMFSSPQRQDQLWGLPSLLPNGYRGLYARG